VFRRRRRGVHEAGAGDAAAMSAGIGPEDEDELADDDEQADDELAGADEPAAREAAPGPGRVDLGDPETWSRVQRGPAAVGQPRESGPWDGAGIFPDAERIDFGGLQVPCREGFDIQINMAEDQGVWIAVVQGESGLQLQGFAAPKTSGLWDEDRQEIAEEIAKAGGTSTEADGPFGRELHAKLIPVEDGPQQRPQTHLPPQPVRFLGVDGPRWFLRGVISGAAAARPELAVPFEEIFADVVVVRGDHPAPPRDLLEIALPEEARAALEEQMQQAGGNGMPNPFERGPEITETR